MKLTKETLPGGLLMYSMCIALYPSAGRYCINEICPAHWLDGKHTQRRTDFAIRLIRARGYARHIQKKLTT